MTASNQPPLKKGNKRILQGISIDPDLAGRAKKLALERGRSFSGLVELLLRNTLQANELERV
jgi:hypothetical protein